MNSYDESYDEVLADEIREYLALSDEQLAGYGLNRRQLEYDLSQMDDVKFA